MPNPLPHSVLQRDATSGAFTKGRRLDSLRQERLDIAIKMKKPGITNCFLVVIVACILWSCD